MNGGGANPGAAAAAGYATALLNLLEDFNDEKGRLGETQRAMLNLLEDFAAEKQQLADTQKAVFNILDDLEAEKGKVEAANRDLTRSNQELEQFAYVASHDLQEPLRMVSSFTQLLQERYGDQLDDRARKYIHYAVDGATRMQRLIRDLLAYSRVGSRAAPLAMVESRSALGEALRNLSAAVAESQARVTQDELPAVLADRSQLVQLFQNLVGNAVKFHGPQAPRVHVSAAQKGDRWVFAVRDDGIGIAAGHLQRIFLIFQRLHDREEYPGTGIGLALCRRIVDRHGGEIWVESEPGKGSTFFFTLRAA